MIVESKAATVQVEEDIVVVEANWYMEARNGGNPPRGDPGSRPINPLVHPAAGNLIHTDNNAGANLQQHGGTSIASMIQRKQKITNRQAHLQLRKALIDHLWSRKGGCHED